MTSNIMRDVVRLKHSIYSVLKSKKLAHCSQILFSHQTTQKIKNHKIINLFHFYFSIFLFVPLQTNLDNHLLQTQQRQFPGLIKKRKSVRGFDSPRTSKSL